MNSRKPGWFVSILVLELIPTMAWADLGFSLDSTCLAGGQSATGVVTVTEFICPPEPCPFPPCPPGPCLPAVVELSSSNPGVISVPETVLVNPPGQPNPQSTSFTITASTVLFPTTVTLTARHREDGTTRSIHVGVLPCEGCYLRFPGLTTDTNEVLGGTPILATVQLACPAPAGGLDLPITISNPAVQALDPNGQPTSIIHVNAGQITMTFTFKTEPVPAETNVVVVLRDAGQSRIRTLALLPGTLDLHVRNIEVTQGIQILDDPVLLDNSLPLVQGKTTAVRVYLDSNLATNSGLQIRNIPVTLWTRPSNAFPWNTNHHPIWPSARLDPAASPQHQRESPGTAVEREDGPLNATFLLGPELLANGTLEFRANVNPSRLLTETDYGNNSHVLGPLNFVSTPDLNIKFLRIDWCPGCPTDTNPRLKPTWESIYPIISYLEKVYPVDKVNHWKARKEVNTTQFGPSDFSKKGAWSWVINKLALMKLFTDDEAPDMHYYALLDTGVPRDGGPAGIGFSDSLTCMDLLPVPQCGAGLAGDGSTAAHEIGHNKGLCHAPCPLPGEDGAPEDIDPNWPTTHPRAIVNQTGFNVDTLLALQGRPHVDQTPFSGGIHRDFMSYCGRTSGLKWVSDHTYQRLFLKIAGGAGASASGPESTSSAVGPEVDHVVVRGAIDETGRATIPSIYHKDFPAGSHDQAGQGCYSINQYDASGIVLRQRNFMPLEDGVFFEIIPYESGTVRIDVVNACTIGDPIIMESCPVTDNTPVVTVLSPAGGETYGPSDSVTMTWSAMDPDGDSLSYMVLFSRNGGVDWEALDSDLVETHYELNTADLPGTESALVRVIATDGVNMAQDDANAIFSIAAKPPEATILHPQSGLLSEGTADLVFRGTATDVEDGALPDASLVWRSNLEGILGTGTEVVVSLSPGLHQITLEVTDMDGNTTTDQISVRRIDTDLPFIWPVRVVGNQFELQFTAQQGVAYQVERQDNLDTPMAFWSPVTNIAAPATDTNIVVRELIQGPQRFYRVRTVEEF